MNSPLLPFELYAGEVGFGFGFGATGREGRFSRLTKHDSGLGFSATGGEGLPHQLLITSSALSSPPQLTSAASDRI
jgi:hypothetical protein